MGRAHNAYVDPDVQKILDALKFHYYEGVDKETGEYYNGFSSYFMASIGFAIGELNRKDLLEVMIAKLEAAKVATVREIDRHIGEAQRLLSTPPNLVPELIK